MADLALMPEEDFMRLIQGVASEPPPPADDSILDDLEPAMKDALLQVSGELKKRIDPSLQSTEAERMGARPGKFLNMSKGAPASTRASMGLDENQLNQFKLLTKKYGPGNVDLSNDGRFILRDQPAPGGTTEDVMVDPVGFESGDVTQMSGQILPMIAGALAGRYGKFGKTGATKAISAVTLMSLGMEGIGGVQDAFIRSLRDDEVNMSEIAKHRATLAVVDEAFGFAALGGAKFATKALEGLSGLLQIPVGNTATTKAAQELAKQTGVIYPLSPGQASESRVLLRLESMIGARLGASGAVDRVLAQQVKAQNELRRVLHGLPRTMSDEQLMSVLPKADVVGQKGLARLGTAALELEGEVAKASQAVKSIGTQEAQALAGVNLSTPLNSSLVGKASRTRTVGDFEAFQSAMGERYTRFLARPEITTRSVNGNALAKAAYALEKDLLPAAERTIATISPIKGPQGQNIVNQTTTTDTLESFVPAKVKSFLDDLKGLEGAKVSVNDLKLIRTSVDNAIAEGTAIPGTDTKQLMSIKTTISNSITDALSGMPDKTLKTTWEGLNKDYASGISRFDRVGIREMLVKEGERGALGNAQIAESITTSSPQSLDRYTEFKDFFGANSPEFLDLQTLARQKVLKGSLSETSGYIDGQLLRSNLRADKLHPEVGADLFGVKKAELHRIGEALAKADGKIDLDELGKLAASKTLTAAAIPRLVAAEASRASAYNNKLVRAAARGGLDAEKIKPSEFVRYTSQMDPDDAAKVMGILSDQPALVQDINRLTVEDIWAKSMAKVENGESISSAMLDEALGEGTQRRTLQLLAGSDTIKALEALVKTTASRESSIAMKGMGKLGGAMDMSQIFLQGQVGELKTVASRFLLAFLYSGPLKRSITNLMTSQERGRFLNGVISSTPFVEALIDRFGSDGALPIMSAFREFIEPMQKKELLIKGSMKPSEDGDLKSLSSEEFDQYLRNNALE